MVREESDLGELLDQFVCVRMVRMRDVDLTLFQFDYDLTWAGVLLEPDGLILGRYGAGHKDSMHYNSLEGLKNTLKRALELHGNLGKHRKLLTTKRDKNTQFKKPRDLPHNGIKKIVKEDTRRKNCVHCHNVQEGLNRALDAKPDYHPSMVQSRFPTPEQCGLTMDMDHGLKIKSIEKGSAAGRARLKAGDELTEINGQKLISVADIIWALRASKDPGSAKVVYQRDGTTRRATLSLKKGWKIADIAWRTSTFDLRPKLGLWVERADESDRKKHSIADGAMLLEVRGVFGREVKKAGFRRGDLVVGVGKWNVDASEREFAEHTRVNYFNKGAVMQVKVLRKGKERTLTVKL